ncbi:DUF2304 family protein [Nocardioides sp. MAH-18]|uniref:DUF2304 family protein n=1 Tax=Nocardioides agri TaxID=2682843 RepID=A0A6L6XM42_9ACTN|nr:MULTISPECIES: DUF2304 domain-containing protein [unclassified Nocardioides]MBA2953474.1 DUF2304 domain-containing protein [Nocardioides sp. CGMCC 1.13656]MVQ48341.1 DUF2304 family protein [Nocardioides sp. MAH-18]
MPIQVLLIASVLLVVFIGVRRSPTIHVQAGKRIAIVLFAIANVYAVLRPEQVNELAVALGVGRGTDLVLYATVVAFMAVTFNVFQRFQQVDRRYTDLARTVALREAETINRERGLTRESQPPVLHPDEHRAP